jgi:hypothetical protein
MLYQVEVLRSALEADEPWTAALDAFPSLARLPGNLEDGPLGRQIARSELLSLLRRYVNEWDSVNKVGGYRERVWLRDHVAKGGVA